MQENTLFPCPSSNQPITEPVIIDHPSIAPFIYDKAAVLHAAETGELAKFGISKENVHQFIFVDHFTNAILQRIKQGKTTLHPSQITESIVANHSAEEEDDLTDLACPVSRNYVTGIGALCTRDGRLYDFELFKQWVQNTPYSPMNQRPINLLNDIIAHPVHKLIMNNMAHNPADIINLANKLTNFVQPEPEYLPITATNTSLRDRRIFSTLMMAHVVLMHALAGFELVNSGKVSPTILSHILAPIAAAAIDIRFEYALSRRAAWHRLGFQGPRIALNVQNQVPNMRPVINIPDWFAYTTFVIKSHLMTGGFKSIMLPTYSTLGRILLHGKAKTSALSCLLELYRHYELPRDFFQIHQRFFDNLQKRLSARDRSQIKKLAEIGVLLGMGAVFAQIIYVQADNVQFYSSGVTQRFSSFLFNNIPFLKIIGNMALYPVTLALSWPELFTTLIATYQLTESLFGEEYIGPPLANMNIALLLVAAMTLFSFLDDYSFNNIMSYIASLVILGTKVAVQDHIEQTLPQPHAANRYRLNLQAAPPEVQNLPIAVKKNI